MNSIMTPISFGKLMNWILEENKKGVVFGIKRLFIADPDKTYEIFGRKLETPFEPAAGPYTQSIQNIVASYVAGSRFFELKTVQKLDGEDLPVLKSCIKADDECYNCEWFTELYVPQTFDEYVRAWFACKVLTREFGLGSPEGFQLSMSMGYDLDDIKTERIDRFIEGMKDAFETVILKECRQWLLDNLDRFEKVSREDVEAISPKICNCVTLSTLHGCPPQEVGRIARYPIEEKRIYTFVKCNPILFGYEYARRIMDDMGYGYVVFGDSHSKDDLQYSDAAPTFQRLRALADGKGLEFGVKITNMFPVGAKQNELSSEEMYMPGKSLYPLSMSVAGKLAEDFGGKLCTSYSDDADSFNVADIMDAGIWPVTMVITMLKSGGYERSEQVGQLFAAEEAAAFEGMDAARVTGLVEAVKPDKHHVKAAKPFPSRKINWPVPLTDCLTAPCQEGCPTYQDITRYPQLAGAGEPEQALEAILNKNPLPFIIGTICTHNCMSKRIRNFYGPPVDIRRTKLEATEGGFEAVMTKLKVPEVSSDKKAAVVGGSPVGSAAAYFLTRGGMKVTLFEEEEKMGGVVRNVIPELRISGSATDNDVKLMAAMGVEVTNGKGITDIEALKKDYDYVVLAVGASEQGVLKLGAKDTMNVLDLLVRFKVTEGKVELGKNVVVIGRGNTAMDTARAVKGNTGVEKASLAYRRTRRYMSADEEELVMVVEDGVEFAKSLAPAKPENGVPYYKKTVLGDMDAGGHRGVVAMDETVKVPVDTVTVAVGEKALGAFYESSGITLDSRRRPQVNQETLEIPVKGVYVAGDGLYGPAMVVEGIRDGKMAAEATIGEALAEDLFRLSDVETIYGRKGRLSEENDHVVDNARCLPCNSYRENCVEICPNRANIFLVIPGMEKHQIIHADYMCNECGNCKSFCPWDSAPYLDKPTLSANEADMENSKNQGFTVLDVVAGVCRVGLQGRIIDYTAGTVNADVSDDIQNIIRTVINDYLYIL